MKLVKFSSSTHTISTGALQGCVLSPLIFSLYTNDCTSKDPSVWCSLNNLELNTLKTVEMIVDFKRKPPLTIMNSTVTAMESFRFLHGTTIPQDLKWDNSSNLVDCEKGPAEVVFPSLAEEVQPATGAAETVLLCHH